ncbi:SRPBCC domain-containing protein [Falsihalocynthiibacter sp. SS001]|uniref:SRPBCC family protein n=1 Tax=Falsihalocynthiibacter sp. SS001 TaxID=3349698 RepID=UPI0036D35397
MTDLSLTVDRTINATPEAVFNAWLNPDMLRKFMLPGDNMSVPSASSDAKEGGRFEVVMKVGDQEIPHAGTYKEISPHERLVFTWESPVSVEDSTVTLTFEPVETGTHVTLTHVRFMDEEKRSNHEGGWARILSSMDSALAA